MTNDVRRWRFHGRVQGVGFRMTARSLAQAHGVRGFVRNCSDGSVELAAAAEPKTLDAFFAALSDAMRGYIAEVENLPAAHDDAEFDRFEIRR